MLSRNRLSVDPITETLCGVVKLRSFVQLLCFPPPPFPSFSQLSIYFFISTSIFALFSAYYEYIFFFFFL